jgi:cytochrome c
MIKALKSSLVILIAFSTVSYSQTAPDESRFIKVELASNLDEPMELSVLPDKRVVFVERKGAIKLYSPKSNTVSLLATIPVFHGLEDGVLGLVADPDFAVNKHIFIFYSPRGDEPIQRVSRFTLAGDKLNLSSEKVIIEIPVQRKECCHSAGSLAFGPDKNLYIAVGDNTNPFNPGYYNSIDERKGREYWDAQRTAGNTNDFRGKILRIKPGTNGSYIIPDGNLFAKNGLKGKPEIYVMGCRNPYRVTVDQRTGYVYWGDVGQNTENNPSRGPISYDEFHQAKGPGFYGWPYFAGNNEAYTDFDFETGVNGPFFDQLRPVNKSPNNTGDSILPPAKPAFIWYSYGESPDFKHLGTGGKSPIIGPVFHSNLVKQQASTTKFPDYYDGKLFIAEWMRDWVNVVSMDQSGKLVSIERFLPSSTFEHPIDLEFGPDGSLYVLEYGTAWFAQNKNSRLVRIEYNKGNRPPIAQVKADKVVGAVPLTVNFTAANSFDYDKDDKLSYRWHLDPSKGVQATGSTVKHIYTRPGNYKVLVQVTDNHGNTSSKSITIEAGNEKPQVKIQFARNQTFYWPGEAIKYEVKVNDKEDGALSKGINAAKVLTTVDKIDMGTDLTFVSQYQEKATQNFMHPGLTLIGKSDCKSCHQPNAPSIGPSFRQVAIKYKDDKGAVPKLAQKIIKGGAGVWGQTAMSAHPQLKNEEAEEMVNYILKMTADNQTKNRIPVKGSFTPDAGTDDSYLFSITYKDRGGLNGVYPQTVKEIFLLRSPTLRAINCDDYQDVLKYNNQLVNFDKPGSYIAFKNIDLSNISSAWYSASARNFGIFEVRTGSPSGPIISTIQISPLANIPNPTDQSHKDPIDKPVTAGVTAVQGKHDIFIVYKKSPDALANTENKINLEWIRFE